MYIENGYGVLNEDRLRQLYDPHYVRRFVSSGSEIQVCLDSRMLGEGGTGVATYAKVLSACLGMTGASRAWASSLLAPFALRPPRDPCFRVR